MTELVDDLSHGPAILLAVDVDVSWVYVDGCRPGGSGDVGIEVSRADGHVVEVTTPAQADALIEALQVARREVWADA